MTLTHEPLRVLVSEVLLKCIKKQLADVGVDSETITLVDIYKSLVDPPNVALGHLAFGCFITAKHLKKAPPQVALALAADIQKEISNNKKSFCV